MTFFDVKGYNLRSKVFSRKLAASAKIFDFGEISPFALGERRTLKEDYFMPKILIIDDDPDIVGAMKIVLESKQYQVTVAGNGEEGLKKVKLDKPQLIILDVMMESIGKGFDVARALKKDPGHKDIPILMLTAIKEKTGLGFEKEAGDPDWLPVDDYCDKPLKPDELISKIETLLAKK